MRRATVLVTAAAAAVVALPLPVVAAPPPSRAAAVMPTFTSISLSTSAVSVSGLHTVPVTVTLTGTEDPGPCSGNVGGVMLDRTSRRWWDASAPRRLGGPMGCVADSGGVRTYRAVVGVPSTADGSWRVGGIYFGEYSRDPSTDGLPEAGLTVAGAHRPRLRVTLTPQPSVYPGRTVTMTVRATFDDTGAPVAGQFVSVMHDGVTPCPGCSGTTDAKGRLVRTLPVTDRRLVVRMPLHDPGFSDWSPDYAGLYADIVVQPVLTASPARSSVPHGTDVDVNGRAFLVGVRNWAFTPRMQLVLQRLVGRHWRTVNANRVRPTGRFTLVATPPRGRSLYRVLMGRQHGFASATSPTFVIRGS